MSVLNIVKETIPLLFRYDMIAAIKTNIDTASATGLYILLFDVSSFFPVLLVLL